MSGAAFAVARLLAVDPHGLGGVVLRGPPGPARDAWLAGFREMISCSDPLEGEYPSPARGRRWPRAAGSDEGLAEKGVMVDSEPAPQHPHPTRLRRATFSREREKEETAPWRRLPPCADEGRLLGGLDLAATLATGRPVAAPGLLAEADGGVLVVPMAERLGRSAAANLAAALDTGEVVTERDGLAGRAPARFAAVLLDEGQGDERVSATLIERLAFTCDLEARPAEEAAASIEADDIAAARRRVTSVQVPDEVVEALCATGLAFGVPSLRVATLALRAAKAAAALAGRDAVAKEDAELAAALVLAPRATRLPAAEDAPNEAEPEPPAPDAPEPPQPADAADTPPDEATPGESETKPLPDSVAEATKAAIPADLLAALAGAAGGAPRAAAGGKSGAPRQAATRGRPAGTRRGAPGGGRRLALVDTLRAAAPWQPLRRRAAQTETGKAEPGRVLVRREDFRIARYKQRTEAVTIVCVDASGSAALNRLAEAKGAVELILADCYVRRDQVALIAFRGAEAAIVLPPTRSLARAKRALAGQVGGGGTPLAAGIEAAALLADAVRRKGQTPLVVMMTDGKANMGRDGRPGRAAADGDARAAATAFRLSGTAAMVLDIAPRPAEQARRLATAMGATYIALAYADAGAMSRAAIAARPPS